MWLCGRPSAMQGIHCPQAVYSIGHALYSDVKDTWWFVRNDWMGLDCRGRHTGFVTGRFGGMDMIGKITVNYQKSNAIAMLTFEIYLGSIFLVWNFTLMNQQKELTFISIFWYNLTISLITLKLNLPLQEMVLYSKT